jgi:DNA-binding XRE family transcriptional regulator
MKRPCLMSIKTFFRTQAAKSLEMHNDGDSANLSNMPMGEQGEGSPSEMAARLVLLREALGYTQAAFSRRLGISYQRLSNWERSTQALPLNGAQLVRRVTGATLDWLYYGIESGLPRDLADKIAERRRTAG